MFDRIISDPAILGGKPCIKGTRISVELLLGLVAQGASRANILKAYSHISAKDVEQALRYASDPSGYRQIWRDEGREGSST